MKITPNPWVANPNEQFYNGSKNTFEINHGNDGECVAEVVHGFDNAKLMAAAPELLAALKDCVNAMSWGDPNDESTKGAWDKITSQAQQAITKAIGEA